MNYLMIGDKYINLTFDYLSSSLQDFLFTFNYYCPNQDAQILLDKLKPFIHLSLQKGTPDISEEERLKYKSVSIKNIIVKAHYKIEIASILSFCIKKETATSYPDLSMVEKSIQNTFYVHHVMNDLIKVAKSNRKSLNTQIYKKISTNPLDSITKKLKQYFNDQGEFLFNLVEDNPYSKFANGKSFAIYYKGGFYSSTNTVGADIANAKIFQSITQAQRYASGHGFPHYALVEIDVSFAKVIQNNNEDISMLDDMIASKQKLHIEAELAKPYENLDELSHLLVGVTEAQKIKKTIIEHRQRKIQENKKVVKL